MPNNPEARDRGSEWAGAALVVGLAFAFVALMWVFSHPGVCK